MNNISNNLKTIGFDKWFLDKVPPGGIEQFDMKLIPDFRNTHSRDKVVTVG